MNHVSVIVPTFNSSKTIEEAVKSIIAITYPSVSLIISDDGSTDDTVKKAQRYQLSSVSVQVGDHFGNMFAHWNHRIVDTLKSESEFIAIYHDDDLVMPEIISRQLEFVEKFGPVDIVFTRAEYISPSGNFLWKSAAAPHLKGHSGILDYRKTVRDIALHGNGFFVCPTALYSRKCFEKYGFFSEKLDNASDLDFFLRVLAAGGKIGFIDEALLKYRISPTQKSRQYSDSKSGHSDFFEVIGPHVKSAGLLNEVGDYLLALAKLEELDLFLTFRSNDQDCLSWFRDNRNIWRSSLGGADKLKISLSLILMNLFRISFLRSTIGKIIMLLSSPVANPILRLAIGIRQKIS